MEQVHIDQLLDDVDLADHQQVIGFRLIHLYHANGQKPLALTPAEVSDLCCVSPTRAAEALAVLSDRGHLVGIIQKGNNQ